MRTSTILKPTDLRAPGALAQLFAHHRQQFGGWVMEDGAGGDGGQGGGDGASGSGTAGAGADDAGDDLGGSGRYSGDMVSGTESGHGFPANTPVADMTDGEQIAYFKYRKQVNRDRRREWQRVTGDLTPAQLQEKLDKLKELEREKLTASERELADARDQAVTQTRAEMRSELATTIYETALETLGVPEAEIPDLVRGFNAAGFITDDKGVDRAAITNFAKKFTTADTAGKRRRDFGAGDRSHTSTKFGDGGRAEAAKRFGKKSTGE